MTTGHSPRDTYHLAAGAHIMTETFLRCNGVERPGVLVTAIRHALEKPDYRRRMYIALTRALSTVRIVESREDLLRDPILRAILRASFRRFR